MRLTQQSGVQVSGVPNTSVHPARGDGDEPAELLIPQTLPFLPRSGGRSRLWGCCVGWGPGSFN